MGTDAETEGRGIKVTKIEKEKGPITEAQRRDVRVNSKLNG